MYLFLGGGLYAMLNPFKKENEKLEYDEILDLNDDEEIEGDETEQGKTL